MKNKKQLTFDVDTKIVKEILGERKYTAIYADIKNYMKKEGWAHIEGSVYVSEAPSSTTKVAALINGLLNEYPYISKCIRNIHQSDVSKIYSLAHMFDYDGTAGRFTNKEKKMSLDDFLKENAETKSQPAMDQCTDYEIDRER